MEVNQMAHENQLTLRRVITVLITTALIVTLCAPMSFAGSSKKKMTAYNSVLKSGNTVYCAGEGESIYKVKVKNGKVTKVRKLVKSVYLGQSSVLDW